MSANVGVTYNQDNYRSVVPVVCSCGLAVGTTVLMKSTVGECAKKFPTLKRYNFLNYDCRNILLTQLVEMPLFENLKG